MRSIAVKMLLGDKVKYFGLVFGVTIATLLISQQVSIFIGLMARTASVIFAVSEPDIWVMDKRVRYIDEIEPLRDVELTNIRSVPGVLWAVPFYKGLTTVHIQDDLTQQVQLIGIDSVSLVGLCPKMVVGDPLVLQKPQSAMMDSNGFSFTYPDEPMAAGKRVELNDNRLTINAICDVRPTFLTFPILYTSYHTALEITPPARNKMSVVLVKAKPGQDIQALKKTIGDQTHLQALTQNEFAWRSINYYMDRTGIPVNFGITVFLGILIGGAITAQTFYIFVMENIRQFATMKAIGVTNGQLIRLVVTQASIVAAIGYSCGVGMTSLFFKATADVPSLRGYWLPWQVMVGTGVLIILLILLSIFFSLRRVFKLDPAIVFRG